MLMRSLVAWSSGTLLLQLHCYLTRTSHSPRMVADHALYLVHRSKHVHTIQVMANAANNANLLAAMRGGGTLFGVVTEVAFKVYNVSDYHGGVITYEDDTNCTTLR